MDKKILSISDAASILGVSDETLRNWEREGKLTHVKLDKIKKKYDPNFVQPSSVLDFKVVPNRNGKLHPTQKPVELCEYLIKTYSNEGDLILDNCAGSGSTLVAAKNLNRQFIGIEKEKEYYDICTERLK
jgi:DNA modification methylase